jgi:hypothetical protein
MVERRSGFIHSSEIEDSDNFGKTSEEKKINYRVLERRYGLIDFDNPPEGVILLGEIPEVAAFFLMHNLSQPLKKSRRMRIR